MRKRGQVTVFVILGILIIAVLGILFYLYSSKATPEVNQPNEFDFSRTEVVKNYLESCIEKSGNEALNLVGKQGGEINPSSYQMYYSDKISYLCYTTSFTSCYNKKPFLLEFVEREVNIYINQNLITCTNSLKQSIKDKGYTIETGNIRLSTIIDPYTTIIDLDYPITIKSNTGAQVQINKFSKKFNIPLGRLIKVAEDVVNGEIKSPQGFFTYQAYELSQNGEIELVRNTWGTTEIYTTNLRKDNYKFQFAIKNYIKQFP